ncbi:MAG: glycosyltransferase family 2 protein [Candidatus Omnitrophota bacterium]|jgi:GT2 family glycosyltransferase
MKHCDIVIPVWNEPGVTRECVDSILKCTDHPYRLIIIDNGSGEETRKYLEGLKGIKDLNILYMRNDKNLGFIKAVNQGIKASEAPYLCLMNNDTVVTDGWLGEMTRAMDLHPEIGLINPSSNTSCQFPGQGESIGNYALGLKRFKGQLQWLSTIRGFCVLIKREVVEKIGLLDEAYSTGYFEETDYSRRARNAGYAMAMAKSSYVYHKGSVSFKKIEGSDALFEKNEKIFYGRWGRPVKIGLFLDSMNPGRNIDHMARDMVSQGHQIWIFLKKGLPWPITLDHYEIRRMDLSPYFFNLVSVYKIFKRRKKKKIDVILTENEVLGRILKMTACFHGSTVLVRTSAEALRAVLAAKSKDF